MVKRKGKNRILTTNIRTIKNSFPRFISLMVMSFLGVFAFAGLMATAPDMIGTLDKNLDSHNVYDVCTISDMGMTDSDVTAVTAINGVETVEPVKELDVTVTCGDDDFVVHLASMPKKLNQIDLIEGHLPEKADEIVVEENFLKKEKISLGTKITLNSDNLSKYQATIVGTVNSALYYNNVDFGQERGSTSIGSGTIKYYAYGDDTLFDFDYYTTLYVTVDKAAALTTSEPDYVSLVKKVTDQIDDIRQTREQIRYDALYAEAQQKINEAREDENKELSDAQKELDDSKETLDDSKETLDDAEDELASARDQLDSALKQINAAGKTLTEKKKQLDSAKKQLDSAKKEIASKKKQLASSKKELDAAKSTLSSSKSQLDSAKQELASQKKAYESALSSAGVSASSLSGVISDVKSGISQAQSGIDDINSGVSALKSQLETVDPESEEAAQISGQISELESQKDSLQSKVSSLKDNLEQLNSLRSAGEKISDAESELSSKQSEYDAGSTQYEQGLSSYKKGVAQIAAAEKEYSEAESKYKKGLDAYNEGVKEKKQAKEDYEEGKDEYDENYQKYQDGVKDYNEGLEDYNEGLDEYNKSKKDADKKIADSIDKLSKLEKPTWYVYDRTDDATYSAYIDASNSVKNLATIFPVVFFAVAVLISLISMNRMVEENRLEIGTIKSMGFPDSMIMSKYITFSLSATMLGSILGAGLGLIVIPKIIYNIYSDILFTLPDLILTLQPLYTAFGFILMIACVCGTSVWTVHQVLKEKPAELLRPKPPKNGKRILLERISFLWNRMKFSNKITARNIFRYKKRVLVTIGGVMGCTALMLSGFGIKDAIVDIPTAEYCDIYQYDGMARIAKYGDDGVTENDFLEFNEIKSAVATQYISADIGEYDGYLEIVNSNDELSQIATFRDYQTNIKLKLETGKAIIDEKLANQVGLKVGDTINLVDIDNREISVEIGSIATNYYGHFVYIDAETYKAMGYNFEPNMIYVHTEQLTDKQKKELSTNILLLDDVQNYISRDKLTDDLNDSLGSLNSVVLILIILSALLSFVVFYNLSNININERQREIATLKVLGFYDSEVDGYITKENIILTIIGIILGLACGVLLSHIVVNTIEIEQCRFMNELKIPSYVYSALLTALFTGIVNVITHFNLKKINMIDSLKSVE